jgi:hypothetical protein
MKIGFSTLWLRVFAFSISAIFGNFGNPFLLVRRVDHLE